MARHASALGAEQPGPLLCNEMLPISPVLRIEHSGTAQSESCRLAKTFTSPVTRSSAPARRGLERVIVLHPELSSLPEACRADRSVIASACSISSVPPTVSRFSSPSRRCNRSLCTDSRTRRVASPAGASASRHWRQRACRAGRCRPTRSHQRVVGRHETGTSLTPGRAKPAERRSLDRLAASNRPSSLSTFPECGAFLYVSWRPNACKRHGWAKRSANLGAVRSSEKASPSCVTVEPPVQTGRGPAEGTGAGRGGACSW